MKVLIFLCLAIAIFFTTPSTADDPEPKHFFTGDHCQFWKLKDNKAGVVETIWYSRIDEGVRMKQGFKIDSQNTFFQSFDFINNIRTQINQYGEDIILCDSQKMTTDEKQAAVILSNKWQEMKKNPTFIKSQNDDKKWSYHGISFLGANHTDVKYVERKGQPYKFKFFDENGQSVKELLVAKFESSCELVQEEFESESLKCQASEAAGNSFGEGEGKRGANSVRVPSHQFDISDPRFAAQREILQRSNTNNTDPERCTVAGATEALMRAIETKTMEYGNWCGVGGEKGVCCQTVCPDGGYDVLCRKHDSSTYWDSWMGITVSPCACDAEFLQESKDFNGCIGDSNSPWRVDPDPTGAVTCEKTKQAAINTFYCMPCLNFECETKRMNYPTWEFVTDCEWVSYWGKSPEKLACDGPCWDSSMKPWDYRAWYDTPKC